MFLMISFDKLAEPFGQDINSIKLTINRKNKINDSTKLNLEF